MALPVVYRQAARREIINVARTYEGQRQGLGGLFLDEIGRIEAHISDGPRLYQLVADSVRRAVLRRFPFGLFYLEEAANCRARLPRSPTRSRSDCLHSGDAQNLVGLSLC